ncbi:purine nucleoside permease [Sphingomonas sp. H39-1-10]|uniref:purine nucleoside permease n=1 Tax=Sphingomonas pollutisoli TaxID=3030829 RepID=UPI0023BA395F|nr:purine nucleoside permease [Sphingomonas pollutisoli]MDF0486710.1 purine nucleoside permease [Sphingomonas pollutisoli]
MRLLTRATILAAALFGLGAPALAASAECQPGGACTHPLPVKVVIVTMFEIGADSGDAPGEFQIWKERRHLDTRIQFPQSYHDLYYNPDTQTLGMVTGMGSIRSATATLALGLDQRFDLTHAYWLVAGIAGVDPAKASIGSAAWARYLVDGDLAHEIDAREIPKDWNSGYFPLHSKGPNDASPPTGQGEVFEINAGLRDWAFALTKDIALPDEAGLRAARVRFTGYPAGQRPPFVLKGDNLAAMTFWHGKLMTGWAEDWVKYWTRGQGEFVTSAMEETGTYQSITYLDTIGRVDKRRFMVLRAGSNYTMPPPGVDAATYLLRENEGYAGMHAALENLYTVGSKVVDELTAHWDRYEKNVPE